MALTLTKTSDGVVGDLRYWIGTVALDSSYPTGGELLAASDFPHFTTLEGVLLGQTIVATKRTIWDPSASKIVVMVEDATEGIEAQAANESDQSGITDVQLVVFGT